MREEKEVEPNLDEEPDEDDHEVTAESVETSLEEAEEADELDEYEQVYDVDTDERLETLSVRATPKQANEFICSNCHLVKFVSQLSNKKKQLCRDCV